MRGATSVIACWIPSLYFNPRSSCEERPTSRVVRLGLSNNFNPRSSCEERLGFLEHGKSIFPNFNPRSSCEERLESVSLAISPGHFNPRSSCEERLACTAVQCNEYDEFQSTLLMRGATRKVAQDLYNVITFQSTLLMRGATGHQLPASRHSRRFQSTLLMRGATPRAQCNIRSYLYFNPRSSCEERLTMYSISSLDIKFQSTLLMRGATAKKI